MGNIVGRFYFKRSANGNLTGEFSNNGMLKISSEMAEPIEPTTDFLGKYIATWIEDGRIISSILTIAMKEGAIARLYSLVWRKGSDIIYWGEAMLCDDILIGDYRNYWVVQPRKLPKA